MQPAFDYVVLFIDFSRILGICFVVVEILRHDFQLTVIVQNLIHYIMCFDQILPLHLKAFLC